MCTVEASQISLDILCNAQPIQTLQEVSALKFTRQYIISYVSCTPWNDYSLNLCSKAAVLENKMKINLHSLK